MNIFNRIVRKYNYILENLFLAQQRKKVIKEIRQAKGQKTIYFACTPMHSNLGDQAQLFCWLRLFKKNFPEYNVVCLPARVTTDKALLQIKNQISSTDKIFVHSGYLIFDPHPELPFICKVVNIFHEMPITIFPQTINLMSDIKQKEISDCFNAHPNLTIVSRDEVSLKNAEKLFGKCKRLLWPDVVTSLIGVDDFQYSHNKRDGIMFCLRNDLEKFYKDEQIATLKARFKGHKVLEGDTTIKLPIRMWPTMRDELIRNIIAEFASYEVIITDRYHGTIFSQIANTPVVVLSSSDHKLSSGVKWFPKEQFGEMVHYAKDLDEAYEMASQILDEKNIHKNPPYFWNEYWSKMSNF